MVIVYKKFLYFRKGADGLTILDAGMDMNKKDDERDGPDWWMIKTTEQTLFV
jgi:hypothetical protein